MIQVRVNALRATTLLAVVGFTAVSATAQVGTNESLLNPNLASVDEMAAVPGLNAMVADAIVDGRPFLSMTDFNAVVSSRVVGDALEEVYGHIWLPINLNTASEEEILMIPGVGARMHHEFEEYRPYAAMAQFRREMGKYVDDDEVARMEQYVFVPIDLNTASDEDILSIPGIGARMLREFKEYRPYNAVAQFRREMGKYVDDDEVARMERYVYIGGM